jgi:O-antigen/teichoic acid export membrane protein
LSTPEPSPSRLKSIPGVGKVASLLSRGKGSRGGERYRRAGITASSSFVTKALNVLISFLSVPLTVHYLGAERYGVWLTISSLLTWMSMTDFGLAGNALINVLAEASGKEDREGAQHYSASAFWALTGVGAFTGLIALVSFRFIPWRSVFQVSTATSTQELQLACALTLGFLVLNFPLSMLQSIYSAYQDGYFANMWGIASNSLALAALVLVSRFHGGLPQLVLALSGTRAAVNVANSFFLFRRYYWLKPSPFAVRWACVKRLFSLGSKYLVTQLASLGIYQSQPMIITQMMGPKYVVIFVVAYKIIALPIDLAYMGTAPFVSAFGEAKARMDWNWIMDAYKKANKASLVVGLPMLAVLAIFAKPIIRVWAGAAAIPSTSLIVGLTLYTALGIALMTVGQLLVGLERVNALAISLVLCALGIIGASILVAPKWGLAGIAFAMAGVKVVTYWPIQLRELRRIFRETHAPLRESVTEPVA